MLWNVKTTCLGNLDDKLSLFSSNTSLYTSLSKEVLNSEIYTWKVGKLIYIYILYLFISIYLSDYISIYLSIYLSINQSINLSTIQALNLTRCILVIIGWMLLSIRPTTDLMCKHLIYLKSYTRQKSGCFALHFISMIFDLIYLNDN